MQDSTRRAIGLLFAVLLTGCANIDSAFYQPDGTVYRTPTADGLTYEDVRFSSADGTRLSGWFIPSATTALGTVIHFHGNAQNMTAHYSFVSWLPASGYNLFVFDYRGYGSSDGMPDRQGVYEDCVAAIQYVKNRSDLDPSKIVILGQSLGAAKAIAVIGNNEFDGIAGVVADSAFASYRDAAKEHAGLLTKPLVPMLISDTLNPIDSVDQISPTPLLFIHGTSDRVVPQSHGKRLYERAKGPKDMWTVKDARHLEALTRYRREVLPRLRVRLGEWVGADSGNRND